MDKEIAMGRILVAGPSNKEPLGNLDYRRSGMLRRKMASDQSPVLSCCLLC